MDVLTCLCRNVSPPDITFLDDGGGRHASAMAVLEGDRVSEIKITNPGSGYTNAPTVLIALPPASVIWPSVRQALRFDCGDLAPYDDYQLEYCPAVGMAWTNRVLQFTPTAATNTQFFHPSGPVGFFRLKHAP